jgi:hypothetical protein
MDQCANKYVCSAKTTTIEERVPILTFVQSVRRRMNSEEGAQNLNRD